MSRFWGWIQVEIFKPSFIKTLTLKFSRDFEVEFWCYLKAVTLVEEFNPQVRCAFGNFCIGYWAGRGSGAATNDLGKYLILEYIFLTFFVHISAVTTAIIHSWGTHIHFIGEIIVWSQQQSKTNQSKTKLIFHWMTMKGRKQTLFLQPLFFSFCFVRKSSFVTAHLKTCTQYFC